MRSVEKMKKKPLVVVTHWIHPEVIEVLEGFCEVVTNRTRESLPEEILMRHCREADGILAFMPDSVDDAFLDQCDRLRIIAGALKGFDNFDVDACTRRGVLFTNVPDLLTAPTAELAMALLLGVSRKCLAGDRLVRGGTFKGWRPVLYGTGLAGKTVGLIGLGAVGQAFARRLNGFECRIMARDPDPSKASVASEMGVELASLEKVRSESDVLALFLPLNASTRHLVDEDFLAAMPQGAILVNVCRGSVVDEEAIADSLDRGHLGAYAADVFEMDDWALTDRPRTIPTRLLDNQDQTFFTPHLGSAVNDVRKAITLEAASQLKTFFDGELPSHARNSEVFAPVVST